MHIWTLCQKNNSDRQRREKNMSEMLEKARKYEKVESAKIAKESRPAFHFSNPVGWMNDPNGFSDYKGEHHLFFQYYPYATAKETAFIQKDSSGNLQGFLYMKNEDEALLDITPNMPEAKRLKVGTFKIDAHNTKLGERFVKKIVDKAIFDKVEEIYVTIFEKHEAILSETRIESNTVR